MADTARIGTAVVTAYEDVLVSGDLSALFGTAETLSGGTATLINRRTGATIALGGAASVSGFQVQQRLSGLAPGAIYHLHLRATGSGGNTRDGIVVVRVES